VTRSHPRSRRPAAPTLVRPRPTRLVPAAVPVPDGVFAPARRDPSIHASPGREIEPLTAGRRRPGRGVELEITGVRPEWADLQRVPPLEVVVSRDRIERRARAKALTPVTLAHEALRFTYPWCTIGSVRSGYHPNYDVAISGGTGVLVGPNLMLTASHVTPSGHGPEGWWMEFTPAFNAQHSVPKPFGSSFVDSYRGIKYASDASPGGTDYVICKLYEPLGKKVGWMGTRSYGDENKYYDQPFTSVGYPTRHLRQGHRRRRQRAGARDALRQGVRRRLVRRPAVELGGRRIGPSRLRHQERLGGGRVRPGARGLRRRRLHGRTREVWPGELGLTAGVGRSERPHYGTIRSHYGDRRSRRTDVLTAPAAAPAVPPPPCSAWMRCCEIPSAPRSRS
jgi:hypothetical protein